MKQLSTMERSLLAFMQDRGYGTDVPIMNMYAALMRGNPDPDNISSAVQQYVGAFVSRINRKQDDYEIVPGNVKRTYRVQLKHKEQ